MSSDIELLHDATERLAENLEADFNDTELYLFFEKDDKEYVVTLQVTKVEEYES